MINIRKFTINDLHTTFEYSSDFENTYYLLRNPDLNIDETKKYIENILKEYESKKPNFISFVIEYNNIHVGEIFSTFEEDYSIIGYIINKKYWNLGIGYFAAKWMIEYLKENSDVKYVIGYCDSRNIPSKKIIEKLNMEYIGTNGVREYNKDVTNGIELKYVLYLNK